MKKIIFLFMCMLVIIAFSGCKDDITSIDKSEFSDADVIEYLQNQGFEFSATEGSTGSTKYIYVSHNDSDIAFQKITNTYIGIMYSWKNGDINDEWAEMKSTYENDTDGEKKQFKAYEKWLEYHYLTSKQVTDALDYYENNVVEYEKMPSVSTCDKCGDYIIEGHTHLCD
jgi:hypothetical protein